MPYQLSPAHYTIATLSPRQIAEALIEIAAAIGTDAIVAICDGELSASEADGIIADGIAELADADREHAILMEISAISQADARLKQLTGQPFTD